MPVDLWRAQNSSGNPPLQQCIHSRRTIPSHGRRMQQSLDRAYLIVQLHSPQNFQYWRAHKTAQTMKGSTAVGEVFGGSAGKLNTPAPKEGSETLSDPQQLW
jgi:hypothetical protein